MRIDSLKEGDVMIYKASPDWDLAKVIHHHGEWVSVEWLNPLEDEYKWAPITQSDLDDGSWELRIEA